MMVEPDLLQLEEAGFASWPAQKVSQFGSWRLRLSPGVATKRINSINCLDAGDDADAARRLEVCIACFNEDDLRPIIRVTPLTPAALVDASLKAGFSAPFDESLVMISPTDNFEENPPQFGDIHFSSTSDEEWISGYCDVNNTEPGQLSAARATMEKIAQPAAFVKIMRGPQCIAVAVGVVHQNLVGLFGVKVDPQFRRAGLGRSICQSIFAWGRDRGAQVAWLQVEADNEPAVKLYSSLGFTERYRYSYRKQEA